MSLRVAHISTTGTFLPEYYSSNEYLLCRGLAKLGHEVILFTADRPPKWQTLRKRKTAKRIEQHDGFTVCRLQAGPEVGIVPLIPSLFPTLMKMSFDIIHAHDFYAASTFYGAIVSQAKRIPFVLTQHNDELPPKVVNALLYSANGHTVGRYIFSCSRKIIALNSAIRAHLVAMGADEDKIEIIPNAVDTCFFSPKRESFLESSWGISSPVVLFVGRLVEDKGIKYLMQAFAEVVEAIPSAKLVIVGKGPQETELRRLQEKFGLNNVFFLGTVESRLMPNVYAGSDVLVLPSVHEPFGNVVIEAMSSGIPVVGSYVGGMKDTIVHGVSGYHVQPRNSKQLSRYMIRLLEDASLGKKLGENARKNVLERYTVGLLLQRVEKIYQQCIVT
ncbi:MAG: glycosyltransferase family 4 protein [Candidatus Bathyarchaeota archaeon]|nr:MAG: glycosyltransferase family 4 protein [Candidatus Bathyarchaeota archaeon]